MIKVLVPVWIGMFVWLTLALYIAQQTFPQDSVHGAEFVLSDYQRCVTVHPGDLSKPRGVRLYPNQTGLA